MSKLPKAFRAFQKQFPDLTEKYEALGAAAHASGPLDDKARQLVKLALAVGARHEGAVRSHTRRAVEGGTSRAEIMQVVALSVTSVGFASAVAAYTWICDELEPG